MRTATLRAVAPALLTSLLVALAASADSGARAAEPAAKPAPAAIPASTGPTKSPFERAPGKPRDAFDRYYRPLLQIDGAHSTIAFAVPFMALSKTDGRFTTFEGALWFDPDDPASAAVRVSILAKSLDTENESRDEDLRSAQFFDVERYPRIDFKSSRVERRSDSWIVTGPLTLHGVTREITFPMRRVGKEALGDPWGNLRAGFEGRFTIHRADFGIAGNGRFYGFADFAIGPDVEVTLRIQAVLWNVARWTTDEKSVVRALQPVLDAKGADAAVAEYHRLKREEADKWNFPEGSLSLLGHRLLQSRRPAEGLAMLALNAEAYPQSTRVWVDLARARVVNGDVAGAAAAARKALALDEHDTMAAMLLSKLQPATAGAR